MGWSCWGRRRRRARADEAAAETRRWCEEAVGATAAPHTPPPPVLETQTPLHTRAVVRPSPLEAELHHHHSAAARRVVGLDAVRRRPAAAVPAAVPAAGPAQPSITPAARRTVDLDAAAAFAATPPPPRMRTPLADANGASVTATGKRRPYRGLSTPALVADLERTLGTRLRPRHATVQKARRGNGDGYEGWLRRHFASPPRRRSKTSPPAARPKVWI